jgi:hypothetical protein
MKLEGQILWHNNPNSGLGSVSLPIAARAHQLGIYTNE